MAFPNLGDMEYPNELARIKSNVEKAYNYFKPNYTQYNEFRKFVFDSSIDSQNEATLKTLKKPVIEFNILEAYISRLRGEFSKQEPSFEVMAGDDKPVDPVIIEVVHGHMKHILDEFNKNGGEYQVYTDTLSGGFSVMKVWTEYAHDMSFNQVIRLGRVYDPVLCGFDPLARQPHKGDGNFCFELFPMLKEDFVRDYPNVNIESLSFTKAIEGFNWSYKNEKDDIVLMAHYYEKVTAKKDIVQLTNGMVMLKSDYEKEMKALQEAILADPMLQMEMEQPPQIKAVRKSDVTHIKRFAFIENMILEEVDTDFKLLPLIFTDGNSIIIRNPNDTSVQQKTRPYVYHAMGIQKLKNFAGQTLANEFENMVQHKFMVAKEAIPLEEDYMQAYRDVQKADTLVYNAYNELAPDKPLPPPQIIPRTNIPQELIATFQGTDQLTQSILGNFDLEIGRLSQSQLSGIAITESATQSNSAAMPYIVGYLQAMTRVAEIIIDLIPKYFVTPRTIPVVLPDGKKTYVPINQPQGVNIQYGENALNVKVEPGVNFSIQKSRALGQIIQLMQASPLFAQFMNTEGLEILLDNIEIKGIDLIKEKSKQWMQKMQQMQQQQMEQQKNQPNPEMMKMQMKQAELQQKAQGTQAKLALDMQKLKHDQMKIMADLKVSHDSNMIQALKAQTERLAKEIDLEIKHLDLRHRHQKEAIETHHKVTQPKKGESA